MNIRKLGLRLALYVPMLSVIILAMPARYASAAACIPAPPQAIAWWPGDANALDVAEGHHGSLAGSASFNTGKVGLSFRFDGSGWVGVPDSPAWTLGSHDFTIELWAKFNSLTGLDPLMAHTDGSGFQNKWIFWYNSTGHDRLQGVPALRFMSYDAGSALPPHDIVVAPWNPATGQWYHLAVTRSGDTYRLYINGSQVAVDTNTPALPDPTAALTIGRAEAYLLNGAIDEPAIYSRALTTQEISAIADAGGAGKCKPSYPVPEYGQTIGIIAATVSIGAIALIRKRAS